MTSLHLAADEPPEAEGVARALARLLREGGLLPAGRAVIGVAGESGSGKSTTAAALARELGGDGGSSVVLFQDDYFIRPPRTNHEYRVRDIAAVGPHEVDLARLARHVADFRAGREGVVVPTVDYPGNAFGTRVLDFGAARVLVVEGTYVLMLPDLDARVFMEATFEDTRARRVARGRDVDSPFVERVLAIEHAIVARQAEGADVLVDAGFGVRRG